MICAPIVVPPVLEHHFCEDERDANRLAWAFKRTLELLHSGPLAQLTEAVLFPDPQRSLDDAELVRLCRRASASGFHACGTAKMGPASDSSAVVDQHGRCHALDSLVVADASIMPGVPRANTNLTCIMIGERIGEWLRREPALYGL
jgi:choline dehydrogenase